MEKFRVQKMVCPQCDETIGYVASEWMGERVELIGERTQSLIRNGDTVAIRITHTFRVHKCHVSNPVTVEEAFKSPFDVRKD